MIRSFCAGFIGGLFALVLAAGVVPGVVTWDNDTLILSRPAGTANLEIARYESGDTSAGDLHTWITDNPNTGNPARNNIVWNAGYNHRGGGGSSVDGVDPSFYLQFESHYEPAGDVPVFELHSDFWSADGSFMFRPFGLDIRKTAPYFATWNVRGDSFYVTAKNNRQAMAVSAWDTGAQMQMFGRAFVRYDGPGFFVTDSTGARVAFVADGAGNFVRVGGVMYFDDPSGGGALFPCNAGALCWRGAGGTTTQIAPR